MSKYQPLSEHLAARGGDEWPASFSELEAVLGFPLPKAARTGRSWWANDPDKNHSRAWAAEGWEVSDVDHAAERVVFRRGAAAGLRPLAAAPAGEIQPAALREAAESASSRMHASRALGAKALVIAGVAVAAALSSALVRGLRRRRGA